VEVPESDRGVDTVGDIVAVQWKTGHIKSSQSLSFKLPTW